MSATHQPHHRTFSGFSARLKAVIALALLTVTLTLAAGSLTEMEGKIDPFPGQLDEVTNVSPTFHTTWPGTTGRS